MSLASENEKLLLIERIVEMAATAESGDRPADRFVREFYSNVPPDDVLTRTPEDLLAAVTTLWQFMAERRPGRAKLRVLDPHESANRWASGRAIVQIVNDDMPFLVDSVTAALNNLDLVVHLVIHPVIPVERDGAGNLVGLAQGPTGDARESVMQVELSGPVNAERAQAILKALEPVLADVRAAVVDWGAMRKHVDRIGDELGSAALPVPASEAAEAAAFLTWLIDDNFTFLGYREYVFDESGLSVVPGAGRGILRNDAYLVFDGLRNFTTLSPEVQQFLRSPQLMMISKSNRKSTVHRAARLDTIGIKMFGPEGKVVGQKLIIGLFTSASYSQSPRAIPVLRRKVLRCQERSGFARDSHDGKALQHILDTYPRDELFQIDEAELFSTARGILHLQERQRIALFVRQDPFERFVSALVYVPRDRLNADVRRRMAAILEQAFGGKLQSEVPHLEASALARIHFTIATTPGQMKPVALERVERQLVEAGRVWADRLGEALAAAFGSEPGQDLLRRFAEALPNAYVERFSANVAAADIRHILDVENGAAVTLTLDRDRPGATAAIRLKTFHGGEPIALSDVLPMLENLGLKVINEMPFEVRPAGAERPVWIQEFEMLPRTGTAVDLIEAAPRFEEAFPAIWLEAVENDGFNRLVLLGGLTVREIVVLRAYCKILRQAGIAFSQSYMEDTAAAHAGIARLLVRLFEAQFDPARPDAGREAEAQAIADEIKAALEGVTNLDEDRILRSFLLLIRKSLRTNFYQHGLDGAPKPYLSIKLASQEIDLLPLPRPLVEIFVYSPRMEGCHLRGGKVARGGIRASDRKEDFRTEVLGLMKAQMVKNSVIVPVGSKGGFIVKRPPAAGDREALHAEIVACYKYLMFGLLDLTDTISGDAIVPPKDVVRRDSDDPYLVVAADKGTATFSDIANGVALDYGFWLGDAFASGGSIGYDHKVMGITARGAWEAVKRHFRELGKDIQAADFTCVGVGDMAGDVFGNGMLLSQHTKLIGAFNHQHIFIDPDPDPSVSWVERKRLFDLKGSSWEDYDRTTLSKGGEIYRRSAKSIALSPEARARLGVAEETLAPAQLIQILLKQPVDLLWFGGIGTYVKASAESHAEAGDRTNDALRINAGQLRTRVIGEGANLAVTQRARIEFALKGGRLNTDAIDNSAGVDTSDHEVNIKIGVGNMLASGKLDPSQRASFLATMTDEVAGLVLEDNYLQTQALSLTESEASALLDQHARLMRALERSGRLDRAIEFLPDDETLAQRAASKRGLTRPELAVLLAYAKNAAYAELLSSDLPDEPELEADLVSYFPRRMQELSVADLKAHRLRREIIATQIANAMVNRMGPSFVVEMQSRAGRSTADIARAYRITRDVFELPSVWRAIEALDNRVSAATQLRLLSEVKTVAERTTRWLLQSGLPLDISARIKEFLPGVKRLAAELPKILPEGEKRYLEERTAPFVEAGVPETLAARTAALANLAAGLDIVRIDEAAKQIDVVEMGRLYYDTGERLGLDALRGATRAMPVTNNWQGLACAAMLDDFYGLQRDIVQRVLDEGGKADDRLASWLDRRQEAVSRIQEMIAEIGRAGPADLAMLTVAGRQLRALTAG
ncbi:MAG TPA: NAD-glutamate dehydrogenase [Aliidongia sp.]|nr:NAD-glutamate dehydrogenase [Aliidongia sp.]